MNFKAQIQSLIDVLDPEIVHPLILENVLIPFLVSYAKRTKKNHFYLWEDTTENKWVTVKFSHKIQLDLKKFVLYAFPSEKDAKKHPYFEADTMRIIEIPTIHLLMTMISSEEVHSLIFYLYPNNYTQELELERDVLFEACQQRLKTFLDSRNDLSNIA
ncbi:MAG: hypothetical protein ACRC6M_16765 [Microcystaceae cyanobacterium]